MPPRTARGSRLRAEAPAKTTLRALLAHNAPRLGLTPAAIEEVVRQSQITYWRAGQQLFAQGDAHDLASFLVAGAVRVMCQGHGDVSVAVQLVRPGHFFGLASLFDPPGPRLFGAIAHVDAVVAVLSQDTLLKILATLPPGRALQLMAYSWRVLSRLLYEKCLQLTMPLQERVLHELAALAHDFGAPHPDGVVIDLPLSQADLAEMVVGSRAKVNRCLSALRAAGQVSMAGRRIVCTRRFPVRLDGRMPMRRRPPSPGGAADG